MTRINSDAAPQAIGPYSQAIRAGEYMFISGQLPMQPDTGAIVEGGAAEQTQIVMQNIGAILKEAGCGYKDVVKTTVFIKNMQDFAEINQVYAKYFEQPYPARCCVEVARLPKDALVEIEAVVYVK